MREVLVELGVRTFDDVALVYGDARMLGLVQAEVIVEMNVQLPKEMAALIAPPTPLNMTSMKRKFAESEMELKLQEQQVELHAIKQRLEAVKAKRQQVVERKVEAVKRTCLIEDLQRCLRISASLDVAIVLDTTQSMRDYIKSARENIQELVDSLARVHPEITLRVAFVENLDAFRAILSSQTANGGCGDYSDVLVALKVAETLEWRSTTRILYHIGDTPCHGVPEFHLDTFDPYPR
eukprot:gene31776-39254_t